MRRPDDRLSRLWALICYCAPEYRVPVKLHHLNPAWYSWLSLQYSDEEPKQWHFLDIIAYRRRRACIIKFLLISVFISSYWRVWQYQEGRPVCMISSCNLIEEADAIKAKGKPSRQSSFNKGATGIGENDSCRVLFFWPQAMTYSSS